MDIVHGLLTRPKADAGHKKRLRKYKGARSKGEISYWRRPQVKRSTILVFEGGSICFQKPQVQDANLGTDNL